MKWYVWKEEHWKKFWVRIELQYNFIIDYLKTHLLKVFWSNRFQMVMIYYSKLYEVYRKI